jgi:cytochrome b6-f complex iron-sulfur subunit
MAKRLSVKEILEQARKGGPAQPEADAAPAEEAVAASSEPEPETVYSEVTPPAAAAAPADVPTAEKLGRPLTLKEKLAAARAAGGVPAAAAKPAAPVAAAPPVEEAAPAAEEAAPAAPADIPTPEKLGRPLTLKEKLAAARAVGASAPAPAAKPAAGAKPAAAAAAKAGPRTLPPLEKITDPRDLAEALRQTGAKKTKEATVAAAAKAAEAGGATPAKAAAAGKAVGKDAKAQTVLPKPTKAAKQAATAVAEAERRGFLLGSLFVSWVVLGWGSFLAASGLFTAMMGRFMFPNVLAEPPSTIKVGLPTNYESEEVNERFKAQWGFWIVRSTRYNGADILYVLQAVCTHLGCPPNWLAGEQKFKCPCHGSGFYISGINFEGPAPRPLERFKVTLAEDGQIIVDKSQKFQQELGQWSDPDSFLAV